MMLFGAKQDETLPAVFTTIFGAPLQWVDMPKYIRFNKWAGKTPAGVDVWLTCSTATETQRHNLWSLHVRWADGSLVVGSGDDIAAAKRDCVRMLSERSREVGRCD